MTEGRHHTMSWEAGAAANAVIMTAYFTISLTLLRSLWRTGQASSNRLGLATVAIFFSCALGHGAHLHHLLLPLWEPNNTVGLATRASFDTHMVAVDLGTAAIGIWYWSLRRHYGRLLHRPMLFEDLQASRRQALELNDSVVQGLAVAHYALAAGDEQAAREAVEQTLQRARILASDLLESGEGSIEPGDLVLERPAVIVPPGR